MSKILRRARAAIAVDVDRTVERFLDASWQYGVAALGAFILGSSIVTVAAQLGWML